MQFSKVLFVLPLALATPIAEVSDVANGSPLTKRDNACHLYPGLTYGNCRGCPSTNCAVDHVAKPSDLIGVRCITSGQSVSGVTTWDWVPGWSCWVSATITNDGCEVGAPQC